MKPKTPQKAKPQSDRNDERSFSGSEDRCGSKTVKDRTSQEGKGVRESLIREIIEEIFPGLKKGSVLQL